MTSNEKAILEKLKQIQNRYSYWDRTKVKPMQSYASSSCGDASGGDASCSACSGSSCGNCSDIGSNCHGDG